MCFLKERLRTWQWFAVGLSVLGVSNLIWSHGAIPWVAITVSITFGLYGLVRKIAEEKMPDLNAFTVEAAMEMVAGTARSMGIRVK